MSRKVIDGPIEDMVHPVVCQCGTIYDSAAVTVFARHADCSVWKAPCCGVTADDRKWCNQPYRDLRTESVYDKYGFYFPAEI